MGHPIPPLLPEARPEEKSAARDGAGASAAEDPCFGPCFAALEQAYEQVHAACRQALNRRGSAFHDDAEDTPATPTPRKDCAVCSRRVTEFAQGKHGLPLCRPCLRAEDEENFEPLSPEERRGLDLVAGLLDEVPWTHWKPGEQPAQLLDWLYLGDLDEAMNLSLLRSKGISAVVNLVNWWELISKRPDAPDLWQYYSSQDIAYHEGDSEDRLFFDMVEKSWPPAEAFIERCRSEGLRVLVNCKAGHNRSACICVCWLVVHEGLTLTQALDRLLTRRGFVLSNHGFRLQLVRLALSLGRLGEAPAPAEASGGDSPTNRLSSRRGSKQGAARRASKHISSSPEDTKQLPVGHIVRKRRLSVKYDHCSELQGRALARQYSKALSRGGTQMSAISAGVGDWVSQRSLSMELLAVLWHKGKNFSSDYDYTAWPPAVIGSGFSGDVVLCRHKMTPNEATFGGIRCVKRFDLSKMGAERIAKLKNEALICMSLEHPHIARLFDAYEDASEVSLVMQYCSGGTLEDALHARGSYGEAEFRDVAVQTLRAVTYIHGTGIVHRDIKPRNFVYEADGEMVKLIDFGFSVKSALSEGGKGDSLQGCMGTLGYLAPEVVRCLLSSDSYYAEKCDLWSLGAVFFELLSGRPAFHRERGQCDGYTEEVVLRDIEAVDAAAVEGLLGELPGDARPFMGRLLTVDPEARPSAREALNDPYLHEVRDKLMHPNGALPVSEVLARFSNLANASKPMRAFLLARARSPTNLPWDEFCALRATFKLFDAHGGLKGVIGFDGFLSVVAPADDAGRDDAEAIWRAVCGDQDSLSYCEFLAALLPISEDVFLDVQPGSSLADSTPAAVRQSSDGSSGSGFSMDPGHHVPSAWDPSLPIEAYLPLLVSGERKVATFDEDRTVSEVVRAMSEFHFRWAIVHYAHGPSKFFDYMDISHYLVRASKGIGAKKVSEAAARVGSMSVGELANNSGHSRYVPQPASAPLGDVLHLITETRAAEVTGPPVPVRRVPIVDERGSVLHVFSCLDFLKLATRFPAPTAVLKSRSARAFDRRESMMSLSVMESDSMLNAFSIMDSANLTICPATCRKLSGDLGGVVAMNVVSVADLKWVFNSGEYGILDESVSSFTAWRAKVAECSINHRIRERQRSRFNVVSVDADDSLYVLAQRLLASRLQRIFLSSEELARIVGIVSSRDILAEALDLLS